MKREGGARAEGEREGRTAKDEKKKKGNKNKSST